MIKTNLCELLGIRYPIFQGGMAWIADASLAAAVSNAGGLGIIAAMNADAQWLREEIRRARELTDRPFGVNIMLMSPFADEVAQVVIEEKIPIVVTGAGNPGKYMKRWVEAGIKVIPVVASTAMAKLVERSGAFAVIAEGGESGGHHDAGAAGVRCGEHPGFGGRRHRRRTRHCGGADAGSLRCAVRNQISGGKGVYGSSEL